MARAGPRERSRASRARRPPAPAAGSDAASLELRRLLGHHLPLPHGSCHRNVRCRASLALRRGRREHRLRHGWPAVRTGGHGRETRHTGARKGAPEGTMTGIFCAAFVCWTQATTGVRTMAATNRAPSVPERIAQYLLFDTIEDAINLYHRLQEGTVFHRYVLSRLHLVAPTCVLIAATSLLCAAGTVMYFADTRSAMVIVGMILAPFIVIGSTFVQAYVLFGWLENRALARDLAHRKPRTIGRLPPIPWGLAATFVVAPLAALVAVHPRLGIALGVILVIAPFAYARLDRR